MDYQIQSDNIFLEAKRIIAMCKATGTTPGLINIKPRRNHEVLQTLLSSFGDEVGNCTDEFLKYDISYSDLSTLKEEDLEMLGITNPEKRKEMLAFFKTLTNQAINYFDVIEAHAGENYNERILDRSEAHLESMRASILAADLKLKLRPASDVIIDEGKNFASQFVLQALDELEKVTDETNDRLTELEETVNGKQRIQFLKKHKNRIIAAISVGLIAGFWFWKTR